MSKTTEWQQRITEWRASGLSAKAFCAGRGFAESTLYAWASRLRANPSESPTIHFKHAVHANTTSPERRIVIEMFDAHIVVEPGFDPSTLAGVLATLQRTKGSP